VFRLFAAKMRRRAALSRAARKVRRRMLNGSPENGLPPRINAY
jgi:hypothetical protein